MRYPIARLRGLGYALWHARHELYHVLIALVWAWVLREWWNEFSWRYVFLSIFASLLPDIEHLFYWFGYGKSTSYVQHIIYLFRSHQWRLLVKTMENGHKEQTFLAFHNIYFVGCLLGGTLIAWTFDWNAGFLVFGAMVIHYLFDIFDDIMTLGKLNPNWKRWHKPKELLPAA